MTFRMGKGKTNKIDVARLERDPAYRKILELDFGEMIPFVLVQIRRRSIFSFLYAGINLCLFIFLLYYIVYGLTAGGLTWSGLFRQTVTGILAGSFLIIPVHELIHGVAYRILGARKIHFGADMQQLIFYVTVDRYPVSGKQLYLLAMMPFVLINISAALILLLWAPQFLLFAGFFLLSHNIMCIGDFAVANYVHHIPGKVYSYDVVSEKKSHFFSQEGPGQQGH